MQTILIPFQISSEDRAVLAEWQRAQASVVRSAYSLAGVEDEVGEISLRPEKDLRNRLKERFPDHPLGTWAIHCATREGLRLRSQRPDGRMVFGGRKHLARRQSGLIDNAGWRMRRQERAIEIVGDRTRWGNRHVTLSSDGRQAKVCFLKKEITLHLPEMSGKRGKLIRGLARLTGACEIGVTASIGRRSLSLSFEPMDLRRLAPGETLEGVKRASREAAGKKARGRPRKDSETHYAANRVRPIPAEIRPIHPEWRDPVHGLPGRCLGIDLNPACIAFTVAEVVPGGDPANLADIRVLHHEIIRLDVPISDARESLDGLMARVARRAISMGRAWNCGAIAHEQGLGKLRWSKKSARGAQRQTINYWVRGRLLDGISRRAKLAGLACLPIWGGYSTTIGNLAFDLPDAAAAAAEMARRGIVVGSEKATEFKERLPAIPPSAQRRRWKDDASGHDDPKDAAQRSAAWQVIAEAETWQEIHREIKAARIGVRRLHPGSARRPVEAGTSAPEIDARYAVRTISQRPGRGTVFVPIPALTADKELKDLGPGVSTL